MLSEIHNVRRRVNKVVDVTADGQAMTLASLQSMRSCQVKLADTDRVYDYVTATESLQRDVENHVTDLAGFVWSNKNKPLDITTDRHGRILVVDNKEHYVLLMSPDGEEVKQLLNKQVKWPRCVCLDEESHKMYVAAEDMHGVDFVSVYDYNVLTGGKIFTEKKTKIHMATVL